MNSWAPDHVSSIWFKFLEIVTGRLQRWNEMIYWYTYGNARYLHEIKYVLKFKKNIYLEWKNIEILKYFNIQQYLQTWVFKEILIPMFETWQTYNLKHLEILKPFDTWTSLNQQFFKCKNIYIYILRNVYFKSWKTRWRSQWKTQNHLHA